VSSTEKRFQAGMIGKVVRVTAKDLGSWTGTLLGYNLGDTYGMFWMLGLSPLTFMIKDLETVEILS
jgi:hypothetical protein